MAQLPIWLAAIVSLTALWTGSVSAAINPVSNWNSIAIQAIVTAGQGQIPATRTLAMVQVAIHDALNAIVSRYERYAFTGTVHNGASVDAAIAAAARDALVGAIPDFGPPGAALAQVEAQYAAVRRTARRGRPNRPPSPVSGMEP